MVSICLQRYLGDLNHFIMYWDIHVMLDLIRIGLPGWKRIQAFRPTKTWERIQAFRPANLALILC